jgi:ferredoxin, 2Fe-2S
MPLIRFLPARPPLTAGDTETLFEALRRNDVPIASSCNGDGVCGRCRLRILEGAALLDPPGDLERRHAGAMAPDERLACQALVRGDIVVSATYW